METENIATPEEVTEAREIGWVPEDEFRGDKARWVDAKTFLDRGRTVLPLVKKKNEQLSGELQHVRGELVKLGELYKASRESIEALQEFHKNNTRQKVEQARKSIIAELKEARAENDTDREVELLGELSQADQAIAAEKAGVLAEEARKAKPTASTAQPGLDPELGAWMKKNTWYGADPRKTAMANGIAGILRADPDNDDLQGSAFYEAISKEMKLREKGASGRPDKVNGAHHTGGSGGEHKKTFNDLTAEGKATCNAQEKKFVGEGRAFKTKEAWRQYYVTTVLGDGNE